MQFETTYQNVETQIRFRDDDTDEVWFDKIGTVVVVTVPPDDPRDKQWRAVQLTREDVAALVEFLEGGSR